MRRALTARIPGWTSDPIRNDANGERIASKYHGFWNEGDRVRAEIQIVPLLIGLFWEVEHAAIYKPDPSLARIMRTPAMNAQTGSVIDALLQFEQEFERGIQRRFELFDEE